MLEDLLLDEPRHVRRLHKADNGDVAEEEGVSDLAVSTNSLAASYFNHPTPHETQLKCSSPFRASS